MPLPDTIVALSTPPGRSLRAMVRVSGSGVRGLMYTRLAPVPGGRGAGRTRLSLDAGRSLPVLAAYFPAPGSYTGEDVLEIQFPGGPALAERVIAALTHGRAARPAHPGEFTARAYLAGKLTLDQAEGVAATIAAESAEDLAAARDLRDGGAGGRYTLLAGDLASCLALVEAGIDFTDQEDVAAISPSDLRARLADLAARVGSMLGAQAGFARSEAPKVALFGPPNAGKSTLFNALLARRRAVTSPHAGTTRDVLSEELDLSSDAPGSSSVELLDLPGLDADAADAVGRLSQRHARKALADADLLLWCDPTGRFEAGPEPIIPREDQRLVRVRTFADRPGAPASGEEIAVCALDGWNLSSLRRAIADQAFSHRAAGLAALLPRHRRALQLAAEGLADALELVTPGDAGVSRSGAGVSRSGAGVSPAHLSHPELIAAALRASLDALDELVGRISPDEILGRIFSSFCIGK